MCICYLPHSPCRQAVPWHCQVRSYKEHLILDAVNYAGVWSTAIAWEGHLLLTPLKGTKLYRFRRVCCVKVELFIFVVVLRRYWCCADILFEVKTTFERLQVLQLSSIWCQFTLQTKSYLHKMCLCTLCRYVSACLYIFGDCLYVRCFCWCLHIAAPKRGRLFHLIEGQYLHEHSYKQLSQLGLDRTQATTVLQ